MNLSGSCAQPQSDVPFQVSYPHRRVSGQGHLLLDEAVGLVVWEWQGRSCRLCLLAFVADPQWVARRRWLGKSLDLRRRSSVAYQQKGEVQHIHLGRSSVRIVFIPATTAQDAPPPLLLAPLGGRIPVPLASSTCADALYLGVASSTAASFRPLSLHFAHIYRYTSRGAAFAHISVS